MKISKVWTFASDSNPSNQYETLQYVGGSTSCNCKGWTRRVAADGTRSCKHTRYVDQGIADHHCTAHHNYESNNTQPKGQTHAKIEIKSLPKLGQRKFAV